MKKLPIEIVEKLGGAVNYFSIFVVNMLPGREGHVGVTAKDNYNFLNAVFWRLKTGAPWRDLPQRYGGWKNVHRRFSRWAKSGVFAKLLQTLTDGEETALLLLDSTVVKAHQHAAGAKKSKEESEALGRYGTLLHPSQRAKYVLGDRAYAGKQLLEELAYIVAEAVIPPHQRSKESRSYNRVVYKERNKTARFLRG